MNMNTDNDAPVLEVSRFDRRMNLNSENDEGDRLVALIEKKEDRASLYGAVGRFLFNTGVVVLIVSALINHLLSYAGDYVSVKMRQVDRPAAIDAVLESLSKEDLAMAAVRSNQDVIASRDELIKARPELEGQLRYLNAQMIYYDISNDASTEGVRNQGDKKKEAIRDLKWMYQHHADLGFKPQPNQMLILERNLLGKPVSKDAIELLAARKGPKAQSSIRVILRIAVFAVVFGLGWWLFGRFTHHRLAKLRRLMNLPVKEYRSIGLELDFF